MIIRTEKKTDYNEIHDLIVSAFSKVEHSDHSEQNLVINLRKSSAYIPELSLVAESDNTIVGHIMFTEGMVKQQKVLILAPLAVSPSYQKQGIGTKLIEKGHEIAKNLNYPYIFVLGSETYYPKFGYEPAENMGFITPNGFPKINFMVHTIKDIQLTGNLVYPKAFNV